MKNYKLTLTPTLTLIIIASIGLAIVPFIGVDKYYLRFLTLLFMWIALSGAWNISSGYTGYIDFGPVVYFGVGAYTTAIMITSYKINFFMSFVSGGIISGLIASIIGIPTLRLKGAYFAIATFAFAESMKQIIFNFDRTFNVSFFQGSYGITLPICTDYKLFYFLMLIFAMGVTFISFFIENSKFGLGLKAINESELVAETLGIDTFKLKLYAYILSGIIIGFIGGVYSYWVTYITPEDVFSIHKTVQMVIMTLLGGMGKFLGPVIGASFLRIVSEIFGTEFIEDYLIIVGIIIILIISIFPSGIMGLKRWKFFSKQRS